MTHSGDEALQRRGQVYTWVLPEAVTKDGHMYRRFRVQQTGLNSNRHRCVILLFSYVCVCMWGGGGDLYVTMLSFVRRELVAVTTTFSRESPSCLS
jgi:hypothetical protein